MMRTLKRASALAAAACLAAVAATAQNAPTYTDPQGRTQNAAGVVIVDPVSNLQYPHFICASGCSGSGGGGGAVSGVAGSFVDGWSVTLGTEADAACSSDAGTCSEIALLKRDNARLTSILTALGSPFQAGASIGNTAFAAPISPTGTNPTSTLTLPATTTAYTAGQLIASSATAGSVVVPSFAISTSAGAAAISRLRLSTNDSTSTAWGGQTIAVDLWTAAPTFTNGDRGAWSPATGTASHLATFSCVMSAEYGDGAYAECSPSVGTFALPKLASGTSVFWTLNGKTGSGVTGGSKVFTLVPELIN